MDQVKESRVRILAVDDEEDILQIYKRVLIPKTDPCELEQEMDSLAGKLFGREMISDRAESNIELKTCFSGEEALERVRTAISEKAPFAVYFLISGCPQEGMGSGQQNRSER